MKPGEEVLFLPTHTASNPCTGKVFTVERHHQQGYAGIVNCGGRIRKVQRMARFRDGSATNCIRYPKSSNDESKVPYPKMKATYYRYIAEFSTGDAKSKAVENARRAYQDKVVCESGSTSS